MRGWATSSGRAALAAEAALMIDMHHKLSRYTGEHQHLVEPFRQADLIDVAVGAIRFGLPKEFVRDVRVRFPNAGFHSTLVGVIGRWIVRHPTNPLPVFKL